MPSTRLATVILTLVVLPATACKSRASTRAPDGLATSGDFAASHAPAPRSDGAAPEAQPSEAPAADAFELDEPEGEAVARRQPRHRPGLGTEYGEQQLSAIVTSPFERSTNRPDVLLSLFYDDLEGVRDMSRHRGGSAHTSSRATTPGGMLAMTVVDDNGRVLPAAQFGNKTVAVGARGQRYRIGIENHSAQRFEAVASVDGLDVIDGSEASFHKRGYVVEPFTSIVIDGWRTSQETVAAFRFSAIDDSYAGRTGRPRNVGVIGVAFFHEEGSLPWQELPNAADPFPGGFTPPPPRRQVSF